jgi:hypothetical protein
MITREICHSAGKYEEARHALKSAVTCWDIRLVQHFSHSAGQLSMPGDWLDFRVVRAVITSALVMVINDFRGLLIFFRTFSLNNRCSGEESASLGKKELLKAASIWSESG